MHMTPRTAPTRTITPPGDTPVKPLTWMRTVTRILAEDPTVPDSTRLLLVALTMRAPGSCRRRAVAGGTSGWDFYAAESSLIEDSGLSRASVARAKTDLIRRGMLVRVSKGGRRGDGTTAHTVYRLALPSHQDQLPL